MGEFAKSLMRPNRNPSRLLELTAPVAEAMSESIHAMCDRLGVGRLNPAHVGSVKYEHDRSQKWPVEPSEHLAAAGRFIGWAASWIAADGLYGSRADGYHLGRAGGMLALALWHLQPEHWGLTRDEV